MSVEIAKWEDCGRTGIRWRIPSRSLYKYLEISQFSRQTLINRPGEEPCPQRLWKNLFRFNETNRTELREVGETKFFFFRAITQFLHWALITSWVFCFTCKINEISKVCQSILIQSQSVEIPKHEYGVRAKNVKLVMTTNLIKKKFKTDWTKTMKVFSWFSGSENTSSNAQVIRTLPNKWT